MIALLVNPNTWLAERLIRNAQEAASTKAMELQILKARRTACSTLAREAGFSWYAGRSRSINFRVLSQLIKA